MQVTLENSAIITLILLTGLSAGLCFTWSNSITPGIARLDDAGFLASFQQMNRAILNPIFFIVFFGPFFLGLINLYLFRNTSSTLIWLLLLAIGVYFLGVVLVTIFGNVPLNDLLDGTDLTKSSTEDLKSLRELFEVKWNRLHLTRTLTSFISFLLLILSLMQSLKSNI